MNDLNRSAALLAAVCGAALAAASTAAAQQAFVHPGIAHSRESIEFVKAQLAAGREPWKTAWEELIDSKYAQFSRAPEPRTIVERGAYNRPDIGSSEFMRDGSAAYTHALAWVLSGDDRHATKSAEIVDAWSATLRSVENHDARLLVGMTGHQYCNAAEILRHTWNGWPEERQARFRSMLRDVWYPVIQDFYPSANGNWDAAMLQTMIAMGVFLDDRDMVERAVAYFREGEGNGSIQNYFNEFGQCQETGRDQAHAQMGLEYLANTCETAWNQGLDLYGELDDRLLLGFEYTAKYNLGHDIPYEPFESFEGRYHYLAISDKARGKLRPMYEKVLGHYHHRRGLDVPYTTRAVGEVRIEAGGSSSLPWGTLMYAREGELAK